MLSSRLLYGLLLSCISATVVHGEDYKPGDTFKDCDVCPEMVVVPAGSFEMGSPKEEEGRYVNEGPQRTVKISRPFTIGKFEVTFEEWDACVADGGCKHKSEYSDQGRGRQPVMNVSWDDITKEYIPWLNRKTGKNYRLPTEAEWEYAARAKTQTPFWWGDTISTDQAWYAEPLTYEGRSRKKTVPVDSFEPNPFGLYNVHGNVWEWVEDCWHDNYIGAPNDGSAWLEANNGNCARRVLRGGSWYVGPRSLRSADRSLHQPGTRYTIYGFRLSSPQPNYKPGDTFKDCDVCPEMVVVPAGEFMMGSPKWEGGREHYEGPQRIVKIGKPFGIGKYEVTFDEWDACVADGGCTHEASDNGWGRGRRPVIFVSWHDITMEYIPWLNRKTGKNYRLPTEAEWEYAARAKTQTPFWWGATISTDQANYVGYTYVAGKKGQYRGMTAPVDSFQPNSFGLYNVHGNVREWVEDCYHGNYKGAPTDGSAWLEANNGNCAERIVRGGSWTDSPRLLRSAYRTWSGSAPQDEPALNLGFRVARTLAP